MTEPQNNQTPLAEQDPILLALQQEFALIDTKQEYSLQNWYLAQLNSIEACETALKFQYEAMRRELAARQRTLEYFWHDRFKEAVLADLAKPENSKKKSVNYLQGRAGYRQTKARLIVTNEADAVNWALEYGCAESVDMKLARTTPLFEKYQADGKLPDGCQLIESTDSFFPKRSQPILEAPAEQQKILGKENENE